MRIHRAIIRHYKNIKEELVLEPESHLSILIGPNSCGKTNILDALYVALAGDVDTVRLYDTKRDITIEVELSTEEKTELSRRTKKTLTSNLITISKQGNKETYLCDSTVLTPLTAIKQFFRERVKRLDPTQPIDFAQLRRDFSILESRYHKKSIILRSLMQEFFPSIPLGDNLFGKKKTFQKISTPVVEAYDGQVPFVRLGSGFQQVFTILLYVVHPSYPILFLDEPEIHLHPSLIKKLAKRLEDKRLLNQVFFTTHSALFVRPDNLQHIIRVMREASGTSSIATLPKHSRTMSRARLIQEFNADNTELFFADKVLLVEGVSDRIFFRGMINKFYKGGKDMKVVHVMGKDNMNVYIDVLDAFRIPYQVVLDRDALHDRGIHIIERITKGRYDKNPQQKIEKLKKHHIFVFSNGALERNYPRRYRTRTTKPLNALHVLSKITKADYESREMRYVKEIIDTL